MTTLIWNRPIVQTRLTSSREVPILLPSNQYQNSFQTSEHLYELRIGKLRSKLRHSDVQVLVVTVKDSTYEDVFGPMLGSGVTLNQPQSRGREFANPP